jgi:NAD(P)-dependent dehydrogenase (short-subunit alcohol dehydrogenase family)
MLKKIAIISGSTRGIGKNIAEKLASHNYKVVITGKTRTDIDSVVQDIQSQGNEALGEYLDLRHKDSIKNLVDNVVSREGKIDVLINNASAMWWFPMELTPYKKYDLVHSINARGTYLLSRECMPYMPDGGQILTHSPPINSNYMNQYIENDLFKYKVAYMVSKLGMSIVASGLAQELAHRHISSNCIWPKTAIETAAMKDNPMIPKQLNQPRLWRKEDIIGDMVVELLKEPTTFTNQFLIDEEYLHIKGYRDFTQYRCDPDHEPPDLFELSKQMVKMA